MTMILSLEDAHREHLEREAVLRRPDADTVIWRYFSVEKFLSFLTSSKLYFAAAPSFEDPYEGDVGPINKQQIVERFGEPELEFDKGRFDFNHQRTFISCWYEDEHESDAMWKLYGNGVAVKTTFGKIYSLFEWRADQIRHSGRVNYIDFEKEVFRSNSTYISYFYKRKAFAHEREVRFLIQDWPDEGTYPPLSPCKLIDLDLSRDLDEFVFSPVMPSFVCQSLTHVIELLKIKTPTRQSAHLSKPVWNLQPSPVRL